MPHPKDREQFHLNRLIQMPFKPMQLGLVPDFVEIGENVHIARSVSFPLYGQGCVKMHGKWQLVPHTGKVVIEDDVILMDHCKIMRAVAEETRIGAGTVIGINAMVGHNCQIGKGCMIISGAQLAGSVRVGDNCFIGAGAVVLNKVQIGHGVTVGAGSVVTKDIPDGKIVKGNPAK